MGSDHIDLSSKHAKHRYLFVPNAKVHYFMKNTPKLAVKVLFERLEIVRKMLNGTLSVPLYPLALKAQQSCCQPIDYSSFLEHLTSLKKTKWKLRKELHYT